MDHYTADLHFFHRSPYIVERRGFTDVINMHQYIGYKWNQYVQPDDRVFIVGDVALPKAADIDELNDILSKLNGEKFLIKGNHDNEKLLKKIGHNFTWIKDRYTHKEKDDGNTQRLFLDHYPMVTWERANYGAWQLHGHCHGSLTVGLSTRLDVGWDVWGRPITFQDIKEAMKDRKYVVVDHHGE